MLLKRIGNAAKRGIQVVLWKVLRRKPFVFRSLPKIFNASYKLDVVIRRTGVPFSRNLLYRTVQLSLRNQRAFRPLSSLAIHYRRLYHDRMQNRTHSLLVRKRNTSGFVEKIRDVFSTNVRYNAGLSRETFPNTIDAYEIGQNIGHGCNAAVYALRVRDVGNPPPRFYECPERTLSRKDLELQHYPLALKLMYNFAFDMTPRLGDNYLWRSMGAELVPLPESAQLLCGKMGSFRPLPSSHPNVVQVLTAFIDRMPCLDDAKVLYPEALPTASFYDIVIDEPRTMFIVMKRYHMTLRDYIKDFSRRHNYHVARVLFGQLLEGCVFLYENIVSQRDMKSDNILLEFNLPDEIPHLVISDFGCALATGSWHVKYVDDTVDLGGNLKMRAPEIVTASPGPDCIVDFRMADSWAAGALGYEIFTRINPFYKRVSSATYKEHDLPSLPLGISKPIRDIVYHLLRRNPNEVSSKCFAVPPHYILPLQRLLPHVAANVVSLSLLRLGGNFQTLLSSSGFSRIVRAVVDNSLLKLSDIAEKVLDDVLFLISAETVATHASSSQIISRAEQQLRATFLCRLNREHIWNAFAYFLPLYSGQDDEFLSGICKTSLADAVKTPSIYSRSGIIHRCPALIST